MNNGFRTPRGRVAIKAATLRLLGLLVLLTLSACGGGGGGDGGFLPGDQTAELEISTFELPAVVALPYAAVLEAAGGTPPYSWSMINDGGTQITLDSDGVLRADTEVPEGTYGLSVAVEDARSRRVEKSFTIVVAIQPLAITSTALPSASPDRPYSALIEVVGGSEPYTWVMVDDGDSGLTLSDAGVLSGSPPSPGFYGLTVDVSDESGTSTRRSLVLEVTGDPTPLTVSSTALPQATAFETYAAVLAASGGTENYSWQLTFDGGTGLTLTDDGILRGKAPAEGVYGLAFRVSDGSDSASQALALTVAGPDTPLTIETAVLPDGSLQETYAAVLTATGGSRNYSWTLLDSGGSGLRLSANGVLSGRPVSDGVFGITARVSDSNTTAVRSLTVRFIGSGSEVDPLTITTSGLPDAATQTGYTAILEAQGGSGNYTWALVSDGGLGSEVSLDANGILSGTISQAGSYGLTFTVNDGSSVAQQSLVLLVNNDGAQALSITTETLPNITTNIYAAVAVAAGGVQPYSWLRIGDNPAGFLVSSDGAITLTSQQVPPPGLYPLTLQVTDAVGTAVRRSYSVVREGGPVPAVEITTTSLPQGIVGSVYAYVLRATGGSEAEDAYAWTFIGDTPTNLELASSTGVLSWTSPVAGDYEITVQVVSDDDTDSAAVKTFTLTIND
jgi:hypothetical protein